MGDAYIVRKGGNTGGDITNAVFQEYFAKSGEISPETFVEFCDTYGVIASDDTIPDIGMVGYGTLPLSSSGISEIQTEYLSQNRVVAAILKSSSYVEVVVIEFYKTESSYLKIAKINNDHVTPQTVNISVLSNTSFALYYISGEDLYEEFFRFDPVNFEITRPSNWESSKVFPRPSAPSGTWKNVNSVVPEYFTSLWFRAHSTTSSYDTLCVIPINSDAATPTTGTPVDIDELDVSSTLPRKICTINMDHERNTNQYYQYGPIVVVYYSPDRLSVKAVIVTTKSSGGVKTAKVGTPVTIATLNYAYNSKIAIEVIGNKVLVALLTKWTTRSATTAGDTFGVGTILLDVVESDLTVRVLHPLTLLTKSLNSASSQGSPSSSILNPICVCRTSSTSAVIVNEDQLYEVEVKDSVKPLRETNLTKLNYPNQNVVYPSIASATVFDKSLEPDGRLSVIYLGKQSDVSGTNSVQAYGTEFYRDRKIQKSRNRIDGILKTKATTSTKGKIQTFRL